jgi:protein SCO1/2
MARDPIQMPATTDAPPPPAAPARDSTSLSASLPTERRTGTAPAGGAVGRLMQRPWFWALALAVLFGLPLAGSVMRKLDPPPPVLGPVPAFKMTDQLGQPFGSHELLGRVWVANFIFTSCQTMCPVLTAKMAEVGKRARHLGPTFHRVSFTVDPERDTPQRLKEYAAIHGADAHKWSFLTGSMAAVQSAVVDGFKIGIDRHKTTRDPTADDSTKDDFWEIVHGEHLVVVDRRLQIRGYFEASAEGMDRLLDALGRVANEP